jgi:adenosine deaminase
MALQPIRSTSVGETTRLSASSTASSLKASSSAPAPQVEAGATTCIDSACFTPLPSASDIDATTVRALGSPGERTRVASALLEHLQAFPSVTTTIALAPAGPEMTHVLVAGRPEAIDGNSLSGAYGVLAHLSGSESIKQAAAAHPGVSSTPVAVDGAARVYAFDLPGEQSLTTVSKALAEGQIPNQKPMLAHLLDSLPKDRRVAVLIGGPSGAGKSSLIKDLQKMAGDRKVAVLTGDMYFRDVDDPDYPKTVQGGLDFDNPQAMHMDEMAHDISQLIHTGQADLPVYDFAAKRPGGWQHPVPDGISGVRQATPNHTELGNNDLLVIDSLHATNASVIGELDALNLPHASVYLDTPRSDDRLLRRVVRDYAERGASAERTLAYWDMSTFPGEVHYIRPTLSSLSPTRDVFYTTQFPADQGLSRTEIEHKVAEQKAYGIAPTYGAFATPEAKLAEFAKAETARLQAIVDDPTATPAAKAAATRDLNSLAHSPKAQHEAIEAFTQSIPKADLHRHLEGAVTPELLLRVANKYGIQLPASTVEGLRPYIQVGEQDKTLLDFLKKFDTIGLAFKSTDAIREITYQSVADAAKDNVKYLELRFSPMYMASQYHLDLHEVMDAVVAGLGDAKRAFDTKTSLIAIVERQMGPEKGHEVEKLAEEYKDRGVVALDLANDEFHYPPAPYAQVFQDAKQAGLKVTVHAGEAGGASNVADAVLKLGADRIGHGVRTHEDPAVEQLVHDRGITLEMCPTSNIQTGAAADVSKHPMKRFLEEGIPVTINTDDPAVSGITLSSDQARAVEEFGLSLDELKQANENSFDGAFGLSPSEKARYKADVEAAFAQAPKLG